jgi:hypothetical protein
MPLTVVTRIIDMKFILMSFLVFLFGCSSPSGEKRNLVFCWSDKSNSGEDVIYLFADAYNNYSFRSSNCPALKVAVRFIHYEDKMSVKEYMKEISYRKLPFYVIRIEANIDESKMIESHFKTRIIDIKSINKITILDVNQANIYYGRMTQDQAFDRISN